MSFSSDVKEELVQIMPNPRHCRIAELAAIVMMCGELTKDGLDIISENPELADKTAELLHRIMELDCIPEQTDSRTRPGKKVYVMRFGRDEAQKIMEAVKAVPTGLSKPGSQNTVDISSQNDDNNTVRINPIVYGQTCCKRAFLRGVFMAAGSISDPEKDYHLEVVTDAPGHAAAITDIMSSFDIDAKIVARKKYFVVYIKDSEQIVDVLNIIEAHVALMELENIRIVKEMRNSVNRKVNCETANIGKTIEAAGRQAEDIILIRDTIGFDSLSPELKATAMLRLEYPESSLAELGKLHEIPVGRSGVNHRLQKLSEMAAQLREGKFLS